MTLKKIRPLIMGAVLAFTFVSCSKSNNDTTTPPPGGGGNGGGGGTSITLNIYHMAFPASTTVKKGTTVKWYNQDGYAHTVTSNDGSTFSSGNLAAGATYSYTANTTGTFNYHCNYHSNMTGTLIVTEQ
jgi:plastocyanin